MRTQRWIVLGILVAAVSVASAATPPEGMSYQGVLRDAADKPLTGSYDMVFRFFDDDMAGNEILLDYHTSGAGGAVFVSGGLFTVYLGAGYLADGSGPGTYLGLGQVFRDYSYIWMSIQVGAETLAPRTQIVSAAYAFNAGALGGISAENFLDTSTTSQTKFGTLSVRVFGTDTLGMSAEGTHLGAHFSDSDSTGSAYLGFGDVGVEGSGSFTGGFFVDADNSGQAYLGFADQGIWAQGNEVGGYFRDLDQSGFAYVGIGDAGIVAYGYGYGGYFGNSDGSGAALCGYARTGIQANGLDYGGYFSDSDQSGYAYVGYGHTGIDALGLGEGGHFRDTDQTGEADVAMGDYGIFAKGDYAGGVFQDSSHSGYVHLGYGDDGLYAWGTGMGGFLQDLDSSSYVYAGYSTYKVTGSGAVSFVQNHPQEPREVIVYASPEGDEVAVYTRGTARLSDGEASVPLGATFRWVTNPDLGLTAHLTAHGDCNGLYVVSLTTDTLVVRETNGGKSDVVFDYLVYGLRIGFEEASIVQEKTREAYIPAMTDHRNLYERRPDLRAFSALERYKGMQMAAALPAVDFTRADALKAAIHEYDPATDPPTCRLPGMGPCPEDGPASIVAERGSEPARPMARVEATPGRAALPTAAPPAAATTLAVARGEEREEERGAWPPSAAAPLLPVAGPVEAGDLLVLDPTLPGRLKRCDAPADPGVVGIALGEATFGERDAVEAPVAVTGLATVLADAQYGAIRPGDLLVSSATPGHAMKAPEILVAGTVIGKALEPLEAGAGTIRIVVVPR